MTFASFDPLVATLAGLLLKATMVVVLAIVAHAVAARWLSAASRHLVSVLAVAMLLALPTLALMLPAWAVPVPTAAMRAADDGQLHLRQGFGGHVGERALRSAGDGPLGERALPDLGVQRRQGFGGEVGESALSETTAPVARVPWSVVCLALYAAGVVVMLAHLFAQRQRVHRMGRDAREVTDTAWLSLLDDGRRTLGIQGHVRLLRSLHGTMPMTFGTRRPAILLPATADTWDADRRRAVVLHELAHVARRDCLAQWAACAMRAVYWCHPGAWWLVARLRLDREFACDDLVLAAGAPPREYARHLLDIAYTFGGGRAPALAVRMARRSQIEVRLQALLDASRDRRRPSALARRATTAGAFAVLLPLASLTSPVPRADEDATPVATASVVDEAQPAASPETASGAAATPRVRPAPAPLAALAPLAAPAPLPALQASTAAEPGGCTWEVGRGKEDQFYLSMRQGRSQTGRSVPLSALEGLTDAQLTTGGAVHFVLRRDAGTFTFDGTARGGVAAGVCDFTASPTFGAELARRGVNGLTPEDQMQLARHDVGLALVDELKTQKYATPSVADLVKAGQHGVHLDYLRGMGALGYATGTLAPLITLRDHGVTPDYARALASLGYAKLPIDQLQRARDHGVTPDYVKGMRDAGHGVLTLEQLITTRDHGVTPEFGQALAAAGYTKVPLDQLVRVRDHGVTADYIRDMKALGIGGPLEDLVRARDHGVTPDYIRALGELGHKGLPLDGLIRMRDHGVTAAYVKDVQAIGYTGLSQDDLVRLRDHGLTADRIRQANARAGSRLSVSDLLGGATGRSR